MAMMEDPLKKNFYEMGGLTLSIFCLCAGEAGNSSGRTTIPFG
jgi:hypothetical protein